MGASLRHLNLPMRRPEDVIPHLGKGELHWKEGRSAHALATSWFAARGVPAPVAAMLDQSPALKGAELVDAFFERDVELGDGLRPSQSDLVAVLGVGERLAVLTVEAKVDEPFGPTVAEWLGDGAGKRNRLAMLCALLELDPATVGALRYQLFHRTAAAILEARRWRAPTAVLLVQSFCPRNSGLADFQAFTARLGCDAAAGLLCAPIRRGGVEVVIGWAPSPRFAKATQGKGGGGD